VDEFGAAVLIAYALYDLCWGDRNFALIAACLGWACALHNRTEIEEIKRRRQ